MGARLTRFAAARATWCSSLTLVTRRQLQKLLSFKQVTHRKGTKLERNWQTFYIVAQPNAWSASEKCFGRTDPLEICQLFDSGKE